MFFVVPLVQFYCMATNPYYLSENLMNLPCYLILQQVKEDIGNKELVLEKINLKLTDALREENDKRASYKNFIGKGMSNVYC